MWTPKVCTFSTNLSLVMGTTEEMLCAHMKNTMVLPEGAPVIKDEADRLMDTLLNGFGINMVVLLQETLYVLQDGLIVELWVRERHML